MLAALPAPLPAGWAAVRVPGTGFVVPFVEEAFFRGFVQRSLCEAGMVPPLAIAVAAALFAVLHDRWLAAFVAGLVFGGLMARRGRLSDAFAARANLIVAGRAVAVGDWSLI